MKKKFKITIIKISKTNENHFANENNASKTRNKLENRNTCFLNEKSFTPYDELFCTIGS